MGSRHSKSLAAMACFLAAVFSPCAFAAEAYMSRELDCILEPNKVVHVSSPVDGVISSISVDRSDHVRKGQLLAELEAGVEMALVNQARARKNMYDDIRAKQASFELSEQRWNRVNELYDKKLVSSDERDEVKAKYKLAKAKLKQALGEQRLAALEYKRFMAALNQRKIRSPISGIVVERYKDVGESVENEPILKIAQIDPLRVEAIAPASMYGKIKTGMSAKVFPEYPKDKVLTAKVTIVDQVVDAASGTFGIRLDLPNQKHDIPGGLKCKVGFMIEDEIPSAAMATLP